MGTHRSPGNPGRAPEEDVRQVPGDEERHSERGHRSNTDVESNGDGDPDTNVEGGTGGTRTTPVDVE